MSTPQETGTTKGTEELITDILGHLDILKDDLDGNIGSERIGLDAHQGEADRLTREIARLEAEAGRLREVMQVKQTARDGLQQDLTALRTDLAELDANIRSLTASTAPEDLAKLSGKIRERHERASGEEANTHLFQDAERTLQETERDFMTTVRALGEARSQLEQETRELTSAAEKVTALGAKRDLLSRLEAAVRRASEIERTFNAFSKRGEGVLEKTGETRDEVERLYREFHEQLLRVVSEYLRKVAVQSGGTAVLQYAVSRKTEPIREALSTLEDAITMGDMMPEEERAHVLAGVLKKLVAALGAAEGETQNFDATASKLEEGAGVLLQEARDAFAAFDPGKRAPPPAVLSPEASAELAQAREALEREQETTGRLQRDLEAAREEGARQGRSEAEARAAERDTELRQARGRIEALEREAASESKKVLRERLARQDQELDRLRASEARLRRDLLAEKKRVQEELRQAQGAAGDLQRQLSGVRAELEAQRTAGQRSGMEVARLGGQVAEKQREIEERDAHIGELQARIAELEARVPGSTFQPALPAEAEKADAARPPLEDKRAPADLDEPTRIELTPRGATEAGGEIDPKNPRPAAPASFTSSDLRGETEERSRRPRVIRGDAPEIERPPEAPPPRRGLFDGRRGRGK